MVAIINRDTGTKAFISPSRRQGQETGSCPPIHASIRRKGARRHTKAHEDFAKEGVLDSENGTAARGGSRRRRFKSNSSSRLSHARHLHSGPTRQDSQPLLALMNRNGPRRKRAIGSVKLAAGSIRVIARLAAMLVHLSTTRLLRRRVHAHKTGHCRDRRPKKRNHQHQKCPLSSCKHPEIAPISNLRIADRHQRRRDLDHTRGLNVTRQSRHERHLGPSPRLYRSTSRRPATIAQRLLLRLGRNDRKQPRPAHTRSCGHWSIIFIWQAFRSTGEHKPFVLNGIPPS